MTSGVTSAVHTAPASPVTSNKPSAPVDISVSLIHESIPSQPKLSPEIAAGSWAAPAEDISALNLNEQEKPGFLFNTLRKFKPAGNSPNGSYTSCCGGAFRLNHTNKPLCSIPGLSDVSITRVNFSADTFMADPPQQIPSKKPKQGSVQVDGTGVISRPHVSVTACPANKTYQSAASAARIAAYNSAVSTANSVRADKSDKKGYLPRLSRHNSAVGQDIGKDDSKDDSDDSDDNYYNGGKNGFNIDKPMTSNRGDDKEPEKAEKKELSDIYTRCCHLREIMPIRATLRQLEGRSGTLPYLRLLNPRPTLIEVLAFSDFISVVPINTVVLNRIDIDEEMLKELLLALASSPALYKLALKNVNLTPASWKILMAFLITNKYIQKLDISIVNPDEYSETGCKYYKIDLFDRALLDWSLLTKTLVARGGIEELILNGCLIPHAQFKDLIISGCSIATKRLGVASSKLEVEDLLALADWTTQKTLVCEGIDLGGNDLSKCVELIRNLFTQSSVASVSLNSCNLCDPGNLADIMEDTYKNNQVRFLDLSYNPRLFPKFEKVLVKYLPLFKELRRFHLNSNNLSSQDVIALAEVFAKCPRLCHVSIEGNRDINAAAAEALAAAVKLSSTITCVDVDPDLIPQNIMRRLSHYCMENMETLFHEDDEYVYDREKEEEELLDNGTELVKAVSYVVEKNKSEVPEDDHRLVHEDRCLLVTDGLARRAKAVREKVSLRIQSIIQDSQLLQQLSDTMREKLIKLYYLDETLQQVLIKYDRLQQKFAPGEVARRVPSSLSLSTPLRPLDQAEAMMEVVKHRTSSNEMPSVKKTSRSSSRSSLRSEINLTEPAPSVKREEAKPPSSGHYHATEDDGVHMLRSNESESSTTSQMRKQEKEEGGVLKFSAFIRQNKSTLTNPENASGETLRNLLITESSHDVSSSNAVVAAAAAASATEPSSHTDHEHYAKGEVDVDSLIAKIKDMSDADIKTYFREKYAKSLKDCPL